MDKRRRVIELLCMIDDGYIPTAKETQILEELRVLYLSGTSISALPESICRLSKLQELYLNNTQISFLPEWLGIMPDLKWLDLSGLTLPSIPESLALRGFPFVNRDYLSCANQMPCINLHGVTLTEQDVSIFLEQPELIPSLYKDMDQIPLKECRVIFLGDGASGKSYTIRRIREDGKKEPEANAYQTSETPGVEILDYRVEQDSDSFNIHFWDFGGQQLLHSMHRCFLSEESCYVVTVLSRETKATARARYWLRNVSAFAPGSPILLYINCWENDDGKRAVDEPSLREEFPMIHNVVYCSAKRAENMEFQEKLMKPIIKLATSSKGISKKVPGKWVKVREAIEWESKRQNYLDRARYHELCEQFRIENEQAPALLSYFNNLGVCFSYHRDQEKKELAEYKLLNPVWLTNAIYAIIEEGMAYSRDGRIERNAVAQMLGNHAPRRVRGKDDYRRTMPALVYSEEECQYVLDVAAVHELCYAVDDSSLFFPALCTDNTPREALTEQTEYPEHIAYCFQYTYLPDNVVHRLMIRCLRKGYIIDHSWLRGMVLGCLDEHRVILRMVDREGLRLDIYFKKGKRPYELFQVLRGEILDISERLSLKCREYILHGEDSFLLAKLLLLRKNGRKTVMGDDSLEDVPVEDLLEHFYDVYTLGRMNVITEKKHIDQREIIERRVVIGPYPWHREQKNNDALRRAIWEAYDKKCVYCGKMLTQAEIEIDHIYATKTPMVEDREMILYLDSLRKQDFDLEAPDYIENYLLSCKQSNDCKNNKPFRVENLRFYHDLAMRKTPEIIELKRKYQKSRRWSDNSLALTAKE